MGARRPALRMEQRYVSPLAGPVLEIMSLRRPGLLLRWTAYHRIVVDERLLTRSFPLVIPPTHLMAVVMLDGQLDLHEPQGGLRLVAGEAALLGARSTQRARWQSATYLDLEWADADQAARLRPLKLRAPDPARTRRLAAALRDPAAEQLETFALAFELFRSIGVPLDSSIDGLPGEPSERDRRLARALEEQLAHLASRATTVHLGDATRLSPRQLQRVVHDFHARYGMNAGNWRDTRNRWRVQVAAVLLSRLELTIAEIAADVGYGSPNGLARAFAKAGLPSPAAVRQALSEKDPR